MCATSYGDDDGNQTRMKDNLTGVWKISVPGAGAMSILGNANELLKGVQGC